MKPSERNIKWIRRWANKTPAKKAASIISKLLIERDELKKEINEMFPLYNQARLSILIERLK